MRQRQQYAVCLSLELRLTTMATNVLEAAQRLQRAAQELISPKPIAGVSCTVVEATAGFVSRDVCAGKTPITDYVQLTIDKPLTIGELHITHARNDHGMSAAAMWRWMAMHDCGHRMMAQRLQRQQ